MLQINQIFKVFVSFITNCDHFQYKFNDSSIKLLIINTMQINIELELSKIIVK